MATAEAALSSFRVIIRHLKKLPSAEHSQMTHVVRQQMRVGSKETDAARITAMRGHAVNVAHMLSSISERTVLVDLYNGEKMSQRDRIEKSAKRVGFQVPEVFGTEEMMRATTGSGDGEEGGPSSSSSSAPKHDVRDIKAAYEERLKNKEATDPIL